jgi:hypothetical protein
MSASSAVTSAATSTVRTATLRSVGSGAVKICLKFARLQMRSTDDVKSSYCQNP